MSALLCERVCLMGQALVFAEAERMLDELTGVAVAAKQIERVCLYFGEAIAEQIPHAAEQIEGKRAYAMLDGSMVLTREQGWKEIKLGRLFAEADHERAQGQRGRVARSAYVAHLGSKDDFLPAFEQALCQAQYEQLVVVADGAAWIWDWAEAQCPAAVQILDYYHVKQALWRYAHVHFTSQKRRLAWMTEQEERLFNDAVDEVIEAVAGYGYRSLADLKQQRGLLGYLKHNRHRMRYGSYRRQGLLIGSGPIESAHRNVIQQRLKLAGQRWSQQGAQAVANLRVVHKSGHWPALVKQTCQMKQAA
jgi:hypothetical protein